MRQAQAGELDHRGVDGVQMARDVGGGGGPVGIEDVAAAEHVELARLPAGMRKSTVVSPPLKPCRRRSPSSSYEYDPRSMAAVWNSIRLANRWARYASCRVRKTSPPRSSAAVGPADRPAIEQVLVEQLDLLGRPRKRRA